MRLEIDPPARRAPGGPSRIGYVVGDQPAASDAPFFPSWSSSYGGSMVRAPLELPGWEIVGVGLRDLALGRCSMEALVVSIGAPRLRQLGFEVASPIDDADHALYQLLAAEDADSAHGRYNALVRRLVSFERAAACGG